MLQTPIWHCGVARKLLHDRPQDPQWFTSVNTDASQPLPACPSQSPQPTLQMIWHCPPWQVGVLLLSEHTSPHPPQFTRSLVTSTHLPAQTAPGHMGGLPSAYTGISTQYRIPAQPSADGNSVDMDLERSRFAENSVRYEAALRFLNGQVKTLLSAIQG